MGGLYGSLYGTLYSGTPAASTATNTLDVAYVRNSWVGPLIEQEDDQLQTLIDNSISWFNNHTGLQFGRDVELTTYEYLNGNGTKYAKLDNYGAYEITDLQIKKISTANDADTDNWQSITLTSVDIHNDQDLQLSYDSELKWFTRGRRTIRVKYKYKGTDDADYKNPRYRHIILMLIAKMVRPESFPDFVIQRELNNVKIKRYVV